MKDKREQIENFFNLYAERFNKFLVEGVVDAEETSGCFSDCFIESSPVGVICGKNDEQFKEVIPQGYAFYKSIGISSMDIVSKDITVLDDYHAMVKVHWNSAFTGTDSLEGSIQFDVIYFLQTMGEEFKIFAYITGDEQAALKENGLI